MEKKNNKIRCVKCGSKFVYIRIKDKQVVCRKCGTITKLKEDQDYDHEKKGE